MYDKELTENLEIIKKAHSILKMANPFYSNTMTMQASFFPGLSEKDYNGLDNSLKAIRQDYAKVLTIMNSIEKTYTEYRENTYKSVYTSVINDQAIEELGCFIEYLFAKYNVILEHIMEVSSRLIVPRLNTDLKKQYKNNKYLFLLNYIAERTTDSLNLLNLDWYKNLVEDRNHIIHRGATCYVFYDKDMDRTLRFKVMTTDFLDNDTELAENPFYATENNLIDYTNYWGLYLSKLIVFFKTIWDFLLSNSEISPEQEACLKIFGAENGILMEIDGYKLPEKQDVLLHLLESIIDSEGKISK